MYLFIHRKDLRTYDLRAFDALKRRGLPGLHVLILDPLLLTEERMQAHSGQQFLEHAARLEQSYEAAGRKLHVLYGRPEEITADLLEAYPIQGVVAHADYTPYAKKRDAALAAATALRSVPVVFVEDLPLAPHAQFQEFSGRSEPYKVFTPFYRKWNSFMQTYYTGAASATISDLDTVNPLNEVIATRYELPLQTAAAWSRIKRLHADGKDQNAQQVLRRFIDERIHAYEQRRDVYAEDGTSGLSRFLNSGALSARTAYEAAADMPAAALWLRQLCWRDFYLYQAALSKDFFTCEQQYEMSALDDGHFAAWANGETGIPIIDAAMTQLNQTGEMPNRLRMVTAMFLTKNLLCPFTLGEAYFRMHLADYDHALNKGGWLWSSSFGYDAAPYFRIMNPVSQSTTHDPHGRYIRRWLPELSGLSDREIHQPRPHAIVDLKASRARAVEVYKHILGH
ncbi:cryptochrome/photolyase family protein [Paenibacillus sp. GCM10012307]|uniref:Deoxyribodipyrimidine photo-lyase n=1 Tax=Paenibacillus roseus TaxID=2798579 RepID=A0A934IZS1_9BACL|nr:deoxyribodipyrimidine photo-lyase [Paenibacillus roseus]MBJ6360689.1 deoxyribodipyrimidine photo-lyase [Paenibacillus roseus]